MGQVVHFNATVTRGEDVVYSWDFGDGNNATGANVEHRFEQPGTYDVTVEAANSEGGKEGSLKVQVDQGLFLPSAQK